MRAFRMPCPHRHIIILNNEQVKLSYIGILPCFTSVKLTGAPLPTMFPMVEALLLIAISCSFASFTFFSFKASSSFFCATNSSAFSFAYNVLIEIKESCEPCIQNMLIVCRLVITFFFAPMFFCTALISLLSWLTSKSTKSTSDKSERWERDQLSIAHSSPSPRTSE